MIFDQDSTSLFRISNGLLKKLDDKELLLYPDYKYVTLSEFSYTFGDYNIVIPKGFLTNGATFAPDYTSAFIFHDYLYGSHSFTSGQQCTREEADFVMEQILKNERIGWYVSLFKFATKINIFYLFTYAWEKGKIRGVPIIE